MMHSLQQEVDRLYAEGAPKRVTDVAEEVLRRLKDGLPTLPAHGAVLFDYAKSRQAQNRYGK
jgi:hypothetical protein